MTLDIPILTKMIIVLSALETELQSALTDDWKVQGRMISFPDHRLVEILFLDFAQEAITMTNYGYKGNIGVVVYHAYNKDSTDQIQAILTIMERLTKVDIEGLTIGNNTEQVARASQPSITSDGETDFRTIMVTVPFEYYNQ